MNYDGPYKRQSRVSLSSAFLLVIFVGAFLIMVAIVVWKPLVHDEPSSAVSADEAVPELQPTILTPTPP